MMTSHAAKHNETGNDERVHDLLTRVSSEFAGAANFLSEYGIATQLAQKADLLITSPLQYFMESQEHLSARAAELLHAIVVTHVKSIAAEHSVAGFWQVGNFADSGVLEYTIAFHDYTLDNRAPFREFRLDYKESGFETLAPLVFHLIPSSLGSSVIASTEIAIA
ncbi:hypothetical protein [Hymenobacter guriensis]|uniref:Uncharacterized protein n=1 Tax=Hymenobacter guriensis TaxID=2793065 RepID=A0ABS0L9H9_9BACT|nr:hypothetical protein [Hymenobacter guriensis]MBG8556157.1 hypothetical protein [Hymenobacter guriensis]